MEYRQKYENLLQTLCNAYNKMFKLLEGVEHCDKELARCPGSTVPVWRKFAVSPNTRNA